MHLQKVLLALIFCTVALLAGRGSAFTDRNVSLCSASERIVFSCPIKRSQKIVSLCASPDLTKDRGYIQYRFGVPGKLELEFPKKREGSSQTFRYSHYFRAQVDRTEIVFTNEGAEYSIFDDYNGEEKPAIAQQGVTVTPAGGGRDVTLVCNGRAKADFSNLEDVLPKVVEP